MVGAEGVWVLAELPTGTVTFLFTDLEGSTRLWEEHPEAMRAALARHDSILRDAVEKRGGCVVKTTGDGLHAAFGTAPDAVSAAFDAQVALTGEDWVLPEPLRVRMGLHSGGAELREGDYFGTAVNRAARVAAAAHGGQIVASAATADLVRDDLAAEVDLVDLGEHRLRDLGRPERIVQITHGSLRRDFPPLRSLVDVPGNLPVQLTSFIGRDGELEQARRLFAAGSLVTLIGVGGVGKTRLALQMAAEVALDFPDGVWFIDLAAVSDELAAPLAVAATLGIDVTNAPFEDRLVEFLRGKTLLLVMDNCEHLVDAAGALADRFLRSCAGVRILATSREALVVEGERIWPVRPLAVPDATTALDVEVALASAPIQLFVDRATAVEPGFQVTPANVASIVEICRRLDGIPLALELAAARTRSLSPGEIAERLDQRFSLLSGGRRGIARHETLRAAVDWSYWLLDEAEAKLLARCAVFAGGWSLEAAEFVGNAGDLGDTPVVDVLTRLADKSLVVVEPGEAATRYRLLETIRQYALERLDAEAETADTRTRHLAHFVDFASRAGPGLITEHEAHWAARMEAEIENIRAAGAWAIETEDADGALRLVTPFAPQTHFRYMWGLNFIADAALAVATPEHPLYPVAVSMASCLAGYFFGDYERAADYATRALELWGEDPPPDAWEAEVNLGYVAINDSRDDPSEHYERALAYARRGAPPAVVAFCQSQVAVGLPSKGPEHLDRALREAEGAVALARTTGCSTVLGFATFALGYALTMKGDPRAVEPLEEAKQQGGSFTVGSSGFLAMQYAADGRPLDALDALDNLIREAKYLGSMSIVATAIELALPVFVRLGDPTTAAELLGAAQQGSLPRIERSGIPRERTARLNRALERRLSTDDRIAAAARGAAMTYDEIIEHVLERIATLRATTAIKAHS